MKLSQPSSARKINTYRVLNLLRKEDNLSKSEISRKLSLNKVSAGEIVNSLIKENIVSECGKIVSSNGRKPVSLQLNAKSRFIIAVDIGPRNTTVSLVGLDSKIIKLERIPNKTDKTLELFCVDIIKSCKRTLHPVEGANVIGVGVTCQGEIKENIIVESSYLPWKNIPVGEVLNKMLNLPIIVNNSLEALVMAEAQKTGMFKQETLYIDWGDRINSILVRNGIFFGTNSNFGHLKVADKGLCYCGSFGCLEAQVSAWALANPADIRLRNLWDAVDTEALNCLIKALDLTLMVTGCKQIVIGGEGSTIPDDKLQYIQSKITIPVKRSVLGDKANIISAAEIGLDEFMFHSRLLSEVDDWI